MFCATLLLGIATTAPAADRTLNTSHPSGQSWNSTGYWSDGQAAHAGDDYFVGVDRAGNPTTGLVVRTPTVDDTFSGNSLNIGNGGTLAMKPGTSLLNTYTISNLILTDGAVISQYTDNSNSILNGKITLSGTTRINAAANNPRKHTINSQLVGTGTLQLMLDYANNDDEIALGASNSTFSGTMEQYGGTVKLTSATPFGNATQYWIRNSSNGKGTLDPDTNINALGTDLVLAASGQVKLDQTVNFKTVTCNGTAIPTGTYTAAALQASYASFFTNDGGTLIVGTPPPPAPAISVSPAVTTTTFSNINVMIAAGDKATKTVTITNSGTANLTFTPQGSEPHPGLVLSGSPLFKIASVSPATTAPLAPGATLTVNLEFGPAALADYSGTGSNLKKGLLSIFTNVTASPRKDLGLEGSTEVPVELSGFSVE